MELILPAPFLPQWIIYSFNKHLIQCFLCNGNTKTGDLVLFARSPQSNGNIDMQSWYLQEVVWVVVWMHRTWWAHGVKWVWVAQGSQKEQRVQRLRATKEDGNFWGWWKAPCSWSLSYMGEMAHGVWPLSLRRAPWACLGRSIYSYGWWEASQDFQRGMTPPLPFWLLHLQLLERILSFF